MIFWLLLYISHRFDIFSTLAAFTLVILDHCLNVLDVFLLNIRQICYLFPVWTVGYKSINWWKLNWENCTFYRRFWISFRAVVSSLLRISNSLIFLQIICRSMNDVDNNFYKNKILRQCVDELLHCFFLH